MHPDYKKWVAFLQSLGIEDVPHTQKSYLGHLVAVYNLMRNNDQEEEVCRGGLFHSIYGTEKFQGFKLTVDRRDELAALIGRRAERLAYWNCFMDRASLDEQLHRTQGPYPIGNRETGERMVLDQQEFDDLCRVHLFDWLEQAPRSTFGWDYRRDAYHRMAQRMGGTAPEAFDRVYALAPAEK